MTAQNKVDLLLSFAKIMARESDLNNLLATMADYAKDLLGANRCSIFLYDAKEDELWTTVAHDTDGEIRIPAESGVAGYSALSKEIQIVVDALLCMTMHLDLLTMLHLEHIDYRSH